MHSSGPEEQSGVLSENISDFIPDWSPVSDHSPEHVLEHAAASEREPDPEPELPELVHAEGTVSAEPSLACPAAHERAEASLARSQLVVRNSKRALATDLLFYTRSEFFDWYGDDQIFIECRKVCRIVHDVVITCCLDSFMDHVLFGQKSQQQVQRFRAELKSQPHELARRATMIFYNALKYRRQYLRENLFDDDVILNAEQGDEATQLWRSDFC